MIKFLTLMISAFVALSSHTCAAAVASPYLTPDWSKAQIRQMVERIARDEGVDPALALAVAKTESNFDPEAVSHKGAIGVMQIMPKTAREVFATPRRQLFDPEINIRLGVRFIKQLLETYGGREAIALSHYNGGSRVKTPWGGLRVIPATQGYVDKVSLAKRDYAVRLGSSVGGVSRPSLVLRGPKQSPDKPSDLVSLAQTTNAGVRFTGEESDMLARYSAERRQLVASLRDLRRHNVKRLGGESRPNGQGSAAPRRSVNSYHGEGQPVNLADTLSRRELVRQWESFDR